MTHPPNVCSHCENGRDPVTDNNGFSFNFQMVEGVRVKVFLHDGCVEPWCQAFNIPVPDKAAALGGEIAPLADSEHRHD
jgi:hypothetical protein